MCVRLRFGDKLVSTSLKVDTKPRVWLRNVVMISLCIMLTSRNQRIFKLISSAEFLEVHQNIQNWFRFLFFFFISVDFDSDLRKKLTFIAGKLRGRSYLHLSFQTRRCQRMLCKSYQVYFSFFWWLAWYDSLGIHVMNFIIKHKASFCGQN